jgi:uncharacterized protein (TIGR02145 family)
MSNNNIYDYKMSKSGSEESGFFNVKGRISRKAFFLRWFLSIAVYALFTFFYSKDFFCEIYDRSFIFFETVYLYIVPPLVLIFNWIQGAKRMHDVNKSGWYFLFPIYNLYLIFMPGTKGNNAFGIDPTPLKNIQYFDEIKPSEEKGINQKEVSNAENSNQNRAHHKDSDGNLSTIFYIGIFALIIGVIVVYYKADQRESKSNIDLSSDNSNDIINGTKLGDSISIERTEKELEANIIWTSDGDGYFIDSRDNNEYAVKRIGDQIWMTDNLRYISNESISFRCDSKNDGKGRLYNWNDAKESVPKGWRLPSRKDYSILINKLSQTDLFDPQYFNAYSSGNAFLETSRCDFEFPQWYEWICFWTSTPYGNEAAWSLIHYDSGLELNWSDSYRKGRTEFGAYYGVRCILNE